MTSDGMVRGSYQLVIHLPSNRKIKVGRLGEYPFPAGFYVYTGSGMGNLQARILRHLKKEKRLRWHVDYLLRHGNVRRVFAYPSSVREECCRNEITAGIPGGREQVPGFGSSDCRCSSHLVHFGRMDPSPKLRDLFGLDGSES